MSGRSFRTTVFVLLAIGTVAAGLAGAANGRTAAGIFNVNPLVSDSGGTTAPAGDSSLVNGWGLTAGPTTPWWTSNNGTNTSTLYSGVGAKTPLTVSVAGGPTGTVFNGNANAFAVSQAGKTAGARFLFATEAGTILGWSPTVDGTVALVGADRSNVGAVYKGLATANDLLYATDFHNGRVDVFDAGFNLVSRPLGFKDAKIPKGFAPFGIQALGGNIFVTFAKQDAAAKDDVPVPGQAYVDEFTPDGQLLARVVNSGKKNAPLNAPWGLALAPANFGVFSNFLLVGNFGDGRISAYTQKGNTWVYKGQLRHADGTPIAIDGLWGLAFGNGASAGPTNDLYFLAGPTGESHGLFGFIAVG